MEVIDTAVNGFGRIGMLYSRIAMDDPDVLEAALHSYGDSTELRQKIANRKLIPLIINLTAAIKRQNEPKVKTMLTSVKEVMARA